MIVTLSGTITEKSPPSLVIEANGLGYEVLAPMTTFYQLPDVGTAIKLYTHFIVREDAQTLYGFHCVKDRALFRALIKVNGVGPKLALTILSGMSPEEFVHCIQQQETARLVGIPGIGKKTAERLIVETRDRLKDWEVNTPIATAPVQQAEEDALSALIALGYKPNDARRALKNCPEQNPSSEALIRHALKAMTKGVAA